MAAATASISSRTSSFECGGFGVGKTRKFSGQRGMDADWAMERIRGGRSRHGHGEGVTAVAGGDVAR